MNTIPHPPDFDPVAIRILRVAALVLCVVGFALASLLAIGNPPLSARVQLHVFIGLVNYPLVLVISGWLPGTRRGCLARAAEGWTMAADLVLREQQLLRQCERLEEEVRERTRELAIVRDAANAASQARVPSLPTRAAKSGRR